MTMRLLRALVTVLSVGALPGTILSAQQAPSPVAAAPRVGVTPGLEIVLTIDELVARVLEQSPGIQAARIDRESAAFNLQLARGLFDPVVTADGSYDNRVTPVSSALGGVSDGHLREHVLVFAPTIAGRMPRGGGSYASTFSSTRSTTNSSYVPLLPQYPTSWNVSFTQPLLRNRTLDSGRRQLRVAQANQALTTAQFRQQVTEIVTAATMTYWDLAHAVENLDVQQDGLAEALEQVASNRRMAEQGLLAAIDVTEAEAQAAIFEGAVAAAQEVVTRAENALKSMMLPDRTSPLWARAVIPMTPPGPAAVTMSVDEAVRTALANRPERTSLDRSVDINAVDTQFYRGQAQPQVDLIGGYTLQGLAGQPVSAPTTDPVQVPPLLVGGYGTSLGTLLARAFPIAHVGVRLTLPIWNRTAEAGVALSLAAGRRLQVQRVQLEQSIEAEVRNVMQALQSADAQLAAATASHRAAGQQYLSEERRLANGLSTVYLLFQRHSALVGARSRENQARIQLSKTIIEFDRVTGTTLERRGISIR